MSIHVCKQCGDEFEYCRACVFRPIRYKDLGYCTKDCYEASKNQIEEVVPTEDVEVVVIKEEDTSTPIESAIEYPYFFTAAEEEVIEDNLDEIKEEPSKEEIEEEVIEIKEENEVNDYEQDNGEDI